MQLDQILSAAVRGGASDVVLKTGTVPRFRFRGELVAPENGVVISPELMMGWLRKLLPADKQDLRKERDFAYQTPDGHRFRVNAFMQRGLCTVVARVVLGHIRSLEELQLPTVISELTKEQRGLILITGVTGSGKSTTLAAMLDKINRTRSVHIVTIEDPIEYVLRDELSVIQQREVGIDTDSFESALRAAMRQNPDVIMIGEMRDQSTTETALRAAETGHLVFSTLHTSDATEALGRLIGMFPRDDYSKIRGAIARALRAVVSQRLIPRSDGRGMVASVEIMLVTGAIRDLITEGSGFDKIKQMIKDGRAVYGMQTFDDSLANLVTSGLITRQDALKYASSRQELELSLAGVGQ
jgi:twitching motility protein PilT